MENTKFKDVLKSYEYKVEDFNYEIQEKSSEDLTLINNDVARTKFLGVTEKSKEELLTRLLHDLLVDIPLFYVQGMSEICSVFVYFYFVKDCTNYADEETYENFRESLKDKYEKVRIVLTNVLVRKFNPLIEDGFKLYEENNMIFNAMMHRRHIKLKETESLAYMGSILTFFYRNVTNMEDAYKIFEIILSCPSSAPFLLLIIFYDKISERLPITSVNNDLYKSVIALEDEFIKVSESLKSGKRSFLKKNAILIGGVVGFVAAVVAYKINKNTKD